MAGYLGTKAVLLSTTAADVVGNAEIGGDLTVGGAFTSQGIDDNASATAMTLDASGNVGIGTSSPSAGVVGGTVVHVQNSGGTASVRVDRSDAATAGTLSMTSGNTTLGLYGTGAKPMAFYTNNTERMRIDSSGNLLVGSTTYEGSSASNASSSYHGANGFISANVTNDFGMQVNRTGTDGALFNFRKDGTTVGWIGSAGGGSVFDIQTAGGGTDIRFIASSAAYWISSGAIYAGNDNTRDLGTASFRWDDIYATNGTIQTSDRNEKQDIEVLSDAEQRVAVACKGLLRKFRWQDAVAEKGDDARIHFGIIAQDLQDAFAAEGLDAGRYAMFISSTWWETQTEVPAVEAVAAVYEDVVIPAVLDEEGNEVEPERTEQQLVTEAVEAKEAYTRTDTYETLEEAPEGATERTRLGVRYPELLAFIIGAM